jgi:glycosyltransferase involved in cell wall biosynthesis
MKKKIIILSFLLTSLYLLSLYSPQASPKKPQKNINYFIAANYYNSEESLLYSLPELEKALKLLNQGDNLFISIVENGSTDQTKHILSDFQFSLKFPNKIILCNQTSTSSWRLSKILGEDYIKKLYKERPGVRYQKMAALRNLALLPLKTLKFPNENQIKVIFLNDVFFTHDQLLDLITTNEGDYDMACSLDFYYQFYDVLVTRDLTGFWFSGYYPYTRHPESQANLTKGLPFKVRSCWNGISVFDASPLKSGSIQFRGRVFNNSTCECVQSECLLFCLDFLKAGKKNIWINPNVKVNYEWKYFFLHRWFGTIVNWIQSWNFNLSPFSQEDLGMGCSMPPYWEPDVKSQYMALNETTCERNASDFRVYNQHKAWLEYENSLHDKFFKDYLNTCE